MKLGSKQGVFGVVFLFKSIAFMSFFAAVAVIEVPFMDTKNLISSF